MMARPDKRSREHAESYKRRKNESILQMIQTLEISSTALTPDNAHPLRPSKKLCLSFHKPTNLKPSLIKSDISTCVVKLSRKANTAMMMKHLSLHCAAALTYPHLMLIQLKHVMNHLKLV